MTEKKILGQYFTTKSNWLLPQIKKFILSAKAEVAYDPFAGNGDILKALEEFGFKKMIGLDIDPKLGWQLNDSLKNIPKVQKSIIITNPPYLAKYSAKRKKIDDSVNKYFINNGIVDLYQLAIHRCINAADHVVAIIPETFIKRMFFKEKISSITILEKNPFIDTENPVCVVCFDNKKKKEGQIKIYKDNEFIAHLSEIKNHQLQPKNLFNIKFNLRHGQIALRAVDMPNPKKPIEFMLTKQLNYNLDKIKYSSRLITIININESKINFKSIIKETNNILNIYRNNTHDILLSPFKGNNKLNTRRRRLDYKTARAILELAILKQKGEFDEQFRLL